MKNNSPLVIKLLMLSFHIIIMHTSASDITLSLPQTTIKAQIGEELQITCLALKCGDEKPGFTWSNLVDSTLSGTVTTVEKTSTLTMKVDAETDGSYRCTVKCDNAPGEKRFHIVAYSLPSDPILHISSLVVGQKSQITCTFPNIYPYERLGAKILLDNKVVVTFDSANIDLNMYEMQNISLTHDLTLVEEMDKKEVKCLALLEFPDYNIDPIERRTAQNLILMYPPKLPQITVLTSTNVKAGEEIHLLCSSDSKPQASVQWVKMAGNEELEMPSDDQGALILSNAVPENSGVYICYAENIAGKTASQVEINVQGLPEKPVLLLNPGTKVEAGQSVIIECLVSSNTKVTLWKMSEDRDILLLLDSTGKTIIDEADPIDTAVYKCLAENQYGVSETSESLTVEYAPRETLLSSSPTVVNEGDTITLTCVSKGVPTPSVSIYKLLTSGESVLLSKDPVVTLSEVTSGIYQCQANNRLGSDKDKLELIVQAPPKNTHIIITPSHTVRKGDSVHIRCISESTPAPKLVLRMETELGIIGLESKDGQYNISHAAVEHTGTYMCESSNVIGQETAEATLTVQAPPQNTQISITPSSVVREGDNVQIRCTSEAFPAPRLALKMKMEHDVVDLESEEGEYNISNAEVRHTGTYICESTNAAGSEIVETTLNVEVPPRNTFITIIPSSVVSEGDSVQIWCSLEGSPDPSLVLKMKTEFGFIMLELFDGSYNITHAGMENTGTYICESTNGVGNHVAETTLTVQIPPRNTTVVVTPSQNIKEGDTVTITCETHSIPSPTIILQKVCAKNNTVLQTNNGTFTLYNVTRNDTGTYMLQIISSAGNKTQVIGIQVQERQQSPKFNPTSIFIFGSVAFVSLGAIASIIYHLKKSKLQGSYSLIKALRSKV